MTRWNDRTLDELERRLQRYRASVRPTTLASAERSGRSPFELLVSCVISLRTKDVVTERASRRLLHMAPTAERLVTLDEQTIAEAIYPAGFYNSKARQLRHIARLIVDRHRGDVPAEESMLLELPGVGRKTANLVLGLAFGIPAICVDAHVHRLSNRLGLVEAATPAETERQLQQVLCRDSWIRINDLLVTFGQHQCRPTSPRCTTCPLADLCPRIGVTRHR